jgi:hypothetical protein
MQDAREVMTKGQVNAARYLAERRRKAKIAAVVAYLSGIIDATGQGIGLIFSALAGRR